MFFSQVDQGQRNVRHPPVPFQVNEPDLQAGNWGGDKNRPPAKTLEGIHTDQWEATVLQGPKQISELIRSPCDHDQPPEDTGGSQIQRHTVDHGPASQ